MKIASVSQPGRHGGDSIQTAILDFVSESRDVSIAIAIPLPVPLARLPVRCTQTGQTGIAIAMDRGIEPVSGTWIDRMNADDT